jgi:hypothetical protein
LGLGLSVITRWLTLRWFSSKNDGLPTYSLLVVEPCRGLPEGLDAQEKSDEFKQHCRRLEAELFAQTTDESTPGFVTFLKEGQGLLQILAPDFKGGCLLAFSSPLRAADYARVQVPMKKFEYFCSSSAQAVFVIAELRQKAGISYIALDRCPRCEIFTAMDVSNSTSAADLVRIWKIAKAIEMTRCDLYLDYARAAAAAGDFLRARNVALELVGHVTAEDPRAHVLLAKLALMLLDKKLAREARTYLSLLRQDAAIA